MRCTSATVCSPSRAWAPLLPATSPYSRTFACQAERRSLVAYARVSSAVPSGQDYTVSGTALEVLEAGMSYQFRVYVND